MDPKDYTLRGADDFLRLDGLCSELLGRFFAWLQSEEGGSLAPEVASDLAHAADRYLRDFVVDIKQTGPTDEDPTLLHQYLGNWYIIHTLTPTHEEVDRILDALPRLYAYLASQGLVAPAAARGIAQTLADQAEFFHARLESFWALTPDGILGWRSVHDYRRRTPQG